MAVSFSVSLKICFFFYQWYWYYIFEIEILSFSVSQKIHDIIISTIIIFKIWMIDFFPSQSENIYFKLKKKIKFTSLSLSSSYSLKIHELSRADDGLYSCNGSSKGGVTVGWGHATVQFPPLFEEQTQDFWSEHGVKVNLTCTATSIPNATSECLVVDYLTIEITIQIL